MLKNKEIGCAITDDHPGAVVLHGHGFSIVKLRPHHRVRNADALIYWGDLDAADP